MCTNEFKQQRQLERQKLKTRDDAWKKLRDSALENSKAFGTSVPSNLMDEEPAPRSSAAELLSLSDSDSMGSIGDITGEDEETGTARGPGSSFLEGASPGLSNGGASPARLAKELHSDFDSAGQKMSDGQPQSFFTSGASTPRTSQQPGTLGAEKLSNNVQTDGPHVRRKSVIPMDPTVLQELQHHRSFE